jgi:hypothetical protein
MLLPDSFSCYSSNGREINLYFSSLIVVKLATVDSLLLKFNMMPSASASISFSGSVNQITVDHTVTRAEVFKCGEKFKWGEKFKHFWRNPLRVWN